MKLNQQWRIRRRKQWRGGRKRRKQRKSAASGMAAKSKYVAKANENINTRKSESENNM